jgi:alpha-mannosidase
MDHRIVRKKIDLLQALAITQNLPLGPWQGRASRHLAPGEYEWLDAWHDVDETSWWPALQTAWLRTRLTVPEEGEGRADLAFGFTDLEGQVWLSPVGSSGETTGEPHPLPPLPAGEGDDGTGEAAGRPATGETPVVPGALWAGLDTWGHQRCPAPEPGEYELTLEFHSVQPAFSHPELRSTYGSFRGGALQLVDPKVQAAVYDFRFALETCEAIPDERRRLRLEAALEEALLVPDLTAPRERLLAQVGEARDLLAARIAEIAPDPEGGRLFLTGHSHIDTAWLWPIRETIRKCGRTFSTACRLMERYPEYRFSCPQPQLYAFVKQHYPALYEEIKRQVAAGRWETTGAMWVEADANISSGEALIRQMLYGLQFFREEFGTRPTLCWLPDVFGYNAGLPQILAGCGLRSFWTWKLHWQSRDDFPHHLFWWEGVDGSRVLAHIPKLGGGGYSGIPNPQQLARSWEANRQKGAYEEQLFPFGYGDGGGGATEEMLEYLRRAAHYPGLPACRQGTAEEFFAEAHEQAGDLPVWVGELYLETHRGTYTTQAETKRGNRKCELALREAEIWGTIENCVSCARVGAKLVWGALPPLLSACWRKVLLHQFHDILPGSSIGEVYEETARDHAQVLKAATEVREGALTQLSPGDAGSFRLFNSLSWERSDLVTLPAIGALSPLVALCGDQRLPTQATTDGLLMVARGVPAVGACTVTLQPGAPPPTAVRAQGNAQGNVLESELYRLELAPDGSLERLYDKRFDREVLEAGQRGNLLQLFQDGPVNEAAWNIEATYEKREYAWEGETTVEITESGPVRARARVTRRHRETILEQDVCLYHNLPRIDFVTRVDWRERQTVLKAAFPLAVRAYHATYEVQFGAYERPTHRNTSWDEEKFEVCAQRWADLSEGGYGVSLLNDCKYGYDCHGSLLRLTLLRGTEYPDPRADLGVHEFTYSLLPHAGDWRDGDTVREAYGLNVPLVARPGEGETISYVTVEGPAILEALKPAEDGDGVIMRLYEPNGGRGRVTVTHRLPFAQAVGCNMVEEGEEKVEGEQGRFQFEVGPYEVRTFRLL